MRSVPWPTGLHREAALRAARRQRRIGAAVVAAQPAGRLVHGQARVAVAARRDPAAAGAQQRRRVAAPVEEHQHLSVAGEVPLDGQHRRGGHPRCTAARRRSTSSSTGGCASRGAPRQAQARDSGRLPTLCRVSSDGVAEPSTTGTPASLRPHHRQVARGVAQRALVLLERGVVLLVDDDEPELRHRREHGRARADARRAPAPLKAARHAARRSRVAEPGMQHRDRGVEALAEARRPAAA